MGPKVETVLVSAFGMPLYHFHSDTPTTSTVSGGLARLWAPLIAAKATESGSSQSPEVRPARHPLSASLMATFSVVVRKQLGIPRLNTSPYSIASTDLSFDSLVPLTTAEACFFQTNACGLSGPSMVQNASSG